MSSINSVGSVSRFQATTRSASVESTPASTQAASNASARSAVAARYFSDGFDTTSNSTGGVQMYGSISTGSTTTTGGGGGK